MTRMYNYDLTDPVEDVFKPGIFGEQMARGKQMEIINGVGESGRLAKLKQLLNDELKLDKPSSIYIADLMLSIKHLQGN